MQKKKINTKDGSEFTVFYLAHDEPPATSCCPTGPTGTKGVTGKLFEFMPKMLTEMLTKEMPSELGGPLPKVEDFPVSVPVFNFPFPSEKEVNIDDSIDSDVIDLPLKDAVYKLKGFSSLVMYLGEEQGVIDGEETPLWRLLDSKKREFLVRAEQNVLLRPSWGEVDDFGATGSSFFSGGH